MQPEKKPIYKKWWFWGIVVLLVIIIGNSSCSSEPTPSPEPSRPSISSTDTPEPTPSTQPATDELTCSVGETVEAKSYRLTVEALNHVDSDNMFSVPDEGKEFIEVAVLIENTSDSEMHVSSLLDFDAYVDDFSINGDLSASVAAESESLDGTIAPGKKLKGSLCYQVPEDWKTLEIKANLGYSSRNQVTMLIENQ